MEFMPCDSIRDQGVQVSSCIMKVSCTYMMGCVSAGQGASFGKMWHR